MLMKKTDAIKFYTFTGLLVTDYCYRGFSFVWRTHEEPVVQSNHAITLQLFGLPRVERDSKARSSPAT